MKTKAMQDLYIDELDSLSIVPIPSDIRSRAGKKAKRKGSSYERVLCKKFSDLWGSKFFRTPMSGGSQLKNDYNLAGDISTPDETFPYHVEAKNQEALNNFYNIFVSNKCPVWKWWDQSVDECPDDKIPILVFTKNFMPSFVMVHLDYGILLERMGDFEESEFSEFLRVKNCVIMTLDRFLSFDKQTHMDTSGVFTIS